MLKKIRDSIGREERVLKLLPNTAQLKKKPPSLFEHVTAWGTLLAKRCESVTKQFHNPGKNSSPWAYLWCRTFSCPNCGQSTVFTNSILQKSGKKITATVEPLIDKNKSIEWKVSCVKSGDVIKIKKEFLLSLGIKYNVLFANIL